MRKWVSLSIVFVALLTATILWAFPKIVTGDYVDVAITEITTGPYGQVSVSTSTTSSAGTRIVEALYAGDTYRGGGSSSGGGFPQHPSHGRGTIEFNLNPERAPIEGPPEDAPFSARLLVHQGQYRRLHAGERLYFYDFETPDGVRHYGYIEAESSTD